MAGRELGEILNDTRTAWHGAGTGCFGTSPLPRLLRFTLPGFHVRSIFPGPASLGRGLTDSLKATHAGVPLSMSRECVVPSETTSTRTWIRLDAAVDLRMPFQVMLAHERIPAMDAAVLSIPEMGLNVRFDVLFASKAAVAVGVGARPSAVKRVRTTDIGRNFLRTDAGIFDRGSNIEIGY